MATADIRSSYYRNEKSLFRCPIGYYVSSPFFRRSSARAAIHRSGIAEYWKLLNNEVEGLRRVFDKVDFPKGERFSPLGGVEALLELGTFEVGEGRGMMRDMA